MNPFATLEEDFDPNVRGGFQFCGQCSAVHGDVAKHTRRFGKLCPKCRGIRGTNGHGATPCGARAEAYRMCAAGLISVRRWSDDQAALRITTHTRCAAEMLTMFGIPFELARSNYAGSTPAAFDCWTSNDGIDLLLAIQHVARQHLSVCSPVAARLMRQHPDVFAEFRTLWRLDAPRHVLDTTLDQIKNREAATRRARLNGLPKNVRPRKPQRRRRRK